MQLETDTLTSLALLLQGVMARLKKKNQMPACYVRPAMAIYHADEGTAGGSPLEKGINDGSIA